MPSEPTQYKVISGSCKSCLFYTRTLRQKGIGACSAESSIHQGKTVESSDWCPQYQPDIRKMTKLRDGQPRDQLMTMYEYELENISCIAHSNIYESTYALIRAGFVVVDSSSTAVVFTNWGRLMAKAFYDQGIRAKHPTVRMLAS